ncbi:MAG: M48 family peptidase [Alphaproteobacteria bacterium]|nr:M48 family peptidase [Alphaproteobacteria bacterium]
MPAKRASKPPVRGGAAGGAVARRQTHFPHGPASSGVIGSVAELLQAWWLWERFYRVSEPRRGVAACLAASVALSSRARTMAGVAYPHRRRIVLNAALLLEGRGADRNSTFLHECAHIVADIGFGRSCGHGPEWQRVMHALGEAPDRCHDIAYLSAAATAQIVWRCVCCDEPYYFVRRPQRRIRDCWCRYCGPLRGRLREEEPRVRRPRGGA